MTDKHIPASKLLALAKYKCGWISPSGGIMPPVVVSYDDLRALIDEAPEVELGVRLGIQIAPTVILSKDFSRLSTDDGILIQSWLNSAYEKIDEVYNRPIPDLTNLVGELVEALYSARAKVVECQYWENKSDGYLYKQQTQAEIDQIDALLTRAKEYLK